MAQKENLKLYGEDKYWNLDLKDEFMGQTNQLWIGNFSNKRDGQIFMLDHEASDEDALMVSKNARNFCINLTCSLFRFK